MKNCRHFLTVFLIFFSLMASARLSQAIPSQFGETGLISQPTAETLNSGNICVGLIGNCVRNDGKLSTILPVFMTLGLGNFLEAYGSYPNVLFNGKEDVSSRGYSNIGFKIRALGKRSSPFKLGVDGEVRRTVSDNINYDGLTDKVIRTIATYNNSFFGIHGNVGYVKSDSPSDISYENQILYGGGLEYLPNSRLRLLTEIGTESSKGQGLSAKTEVTAGVQYFISPHLTFNLAVAKGFSDESPDWRALFGFSSCQGIGTYQRVIPRKIEQPVEKAVEERVETKQLKVRTLTPLMPKKKIVEPTSKYEIPVGEQAEVVTLSPPALVAGSVVSPSSASIAPPMAISSGIPLLQVAPEISAAVATTAISLPVSSPSILPLATDAPASVVPGGATVILLNAGAAPIVTDTIIVTPVNSSETTPMKQIQAVAYKKFRLPSTVTFAFDDSTLSEEGKIAIAGVVDVIKAEKRWFVLRVDGFTDSLGSNDYNLKLGLKRAIAVAKFMVTNNGIDPLIVFVKSSGEDEAIATNETEEGRTLNRRAEIVLFVQKDQ